MLTRLVARASDQWTLMVFNESAVIIHCRMRYARVLLFPFCPFNFYLKDDFRSCCSHRPTLCCVYSSKQTVELSHSIRSTRKTEKPYKTDIELSFWGFPLLLVHII